VLRALTFALNCKIEKQEVLERSCYPLRSRKTLFQAARLQKEHAVWPRQSMGLSEAAVDGCGQTFSQSVSTLRAVWLAPKRVSELLPAFLRKQNLIVHTPTNPHTRETPMRGGQPKYRCRLNSHRPALSPMARRVP
jgi:hypothetical protein